MTEHNPRNFGFHIHGCPERAPDGVYRGFVCCAQAGHDGDHVITCGSSKPPYHHVVYEWSTRTPDDDHA